MLSCLASLDLFECMARDARGGLLHVRDHADVNPGLDRSPHFSSLQRRVFLGAAARPPAVQVRVIHRRADAVVEHPGRVHMSIVEVFLFLAAPRATVPPCRLGDTIVVGGGQVERGCSCRHGGAARDAAGGRRATHGSRVLRRATEIPAVFLGWLGLDRLSTMTVDVVIGTLVGRGWESGCEGQSAAGSLDAA